MSKVTIPTFQQRMPGKLFAKAGGLALTDYSVSPDTDSASMSARGRICTSRKDRQGDVIEPSGVDWSDYANAPTVMYDHGFTGIVIPIARSEDEDGRLHVSYDVDEDAIYARSFFSERQELSYQMFGLINEGFLKALSIHVIPVDGGLVTNLDETSWVKLSSLVEYSWCSIAVNPDAYAKALTKDSEFSELLALQLEAANRILRQGSLGNTKLNKSIAKSLAAIQPTAGTTVFGERLMKKSLNSQELEQIGKNPIALAKALSSVEYSDETVKQLRSLAKAMNDGEDFTKADVVPPVNSETVTETTETTEVAPETEDAPVVDETPLGAKVAEAARMDIVDAIARFEAALKPVENATLKEGMATILEQLQATIPAIEGVYSEAYPDLPAIGGAESESEPPDAEMIKSWLASSSTTRYQVLGLASRLETLAKSLTTDTKARNLVADTARDLRILHGKAKGFKPEANDPRVPKLTEMVDKLQAQVQRMITEPAQV